MSCHGDAPPPPSAAIFRCRLRPTFNAAWSPRAATRHIRSRRRSSTRHCRCPSPPCRRCFCARLTPPPPSQSSFAASTARQNNSAGVIRRIRYILHTIFQQRLISVKIRSRLFVHPGWENVSHATYHPQHSHATASPPSASSCRFLFARRSAKRKARALPRACAPDHSGTATNVATVALFSPTPLLRRHSAAAPQIAAPSVRRCALRRRRCRDAASLMLPPPLPPCFENDALKAQRRAAPILMSLYTPLTRYAPRAISAIFCSCRLISLAYAPPMPRTRAATVRPSNPADVFRHAA